MGTISLVLEAQAGELMHLAFWSRHKLEVSCNSQKERPKEETRHVLEWSRPAPILTQCKPFLEEGSREPKCNCDIVFQQQVDTHDPI